VGNILQNHYVSKIKYLNIQKCNATVNEKNLDFE
jgi:hypothetical protein